MIDEVKSTTNDIEDNNGSKPISTSPWDLKSYNIDRDEFSKETQEITSDFKKSRNVSKNNRNEVNDREDV